MESIDWKKAALDSEIEHSKAFGSEPMWYTNFIHLYNSLCLDVEISIERLE
jgi:hypothetical protein